MANKIVAGLNWGAFNHVAHALQLRSCNYYLACMPEGYYKISVVASTLGVVAELCPSFLVVLSNVWWGLLG